MFCPKCGIGNLVDQKFCRGCGHALAGRKAALENNFAETVEKIKSGSTVLGLSAAGLIVISLMALGVWISQKDAGVFFTLIPVLAFMIPATVVGLVRLTRAYSALSPTDRRDGKAVAQLKTAAVNYGCRPARSGRAGPALGHRTYDAQLGISRAGFR